MKHESHHTNDSGLDAVLFDLYGTLVDLSVDEDSEEVWTKISSHLGMGKDAETASGTRDWYRRLCAEVAEQESDESILPRVFNTMLSESLGRGPNPEEIRGFAEHFRRTSRTRLEVRSFVRPLIEWLGEVGVRYAIVSNTESLLSEVDLMDSGLSSLFHVVVMSSDVGASKPDKIPFTTALDQLQVPPERALMVGDNLRDDIAGADHAEMRSVWLTRDPHPLVEIDAPRSCIGVSTPELAGIRSLIKPLIKARVLQP